MLEKEVRRSILRILYEDSKTDSPGNFDCEEFLEEIPGATQKQVDRILKDMHANGFFEFAVFYDQGGGIVSGLTSSAVSEYEEQYMSGDAMPFEADINVSSITMNRNVFVVHGHDGEMKAEVARLLERLGFNPIILSEQPNGGRTIIEKFEDHSQQVGYAIVLMSDKDDVGRAIEDSVLRPRARQNVILELGYFIGRLGRKRVCVLRKDGVEDPSDILGIVYTPYASGSMEWKYSVARELKDVGYDVDLGAI